MKNATHSHPTDARQALRALLVEAGNTLQAVYEECPWPGPSTPEHTQRWNAAYSHHKEVREAYSALVKSLYYPRPDPPQRFDYAAILLQGERVGKLRDRREARRARLTTYADQAEVIDLYHEWRSAELDYAIVWDWYRKKFEGAPKKPAAKQSTMHRDKDGILIVRLQRRRKPKVRSA